MGIALLTLSSLFNGLSALQSGRKPASVNRSSAAHAPAPGVWRLARPNRCWPVSSRSITALGEPTRPSTLRVLRVCEAPSHSGDTGRLVISGRLADVCAELDRMAAREAAQEAAAQRH